MSAVAFEASAADPSAPATIYAIAPDYLGRDVALFRRVRAEAIWVCVSDSLRGSNEVFDPSAVVVRRVNHDLDNS